MNVIHMHLEDQLLRCDTAIERNGRVREMRYSFGIENSLLKHPPSRMRDELKEHQDKIHPTILHPTLLPLFTTFSALFLATGYDESYAEFSLDAATLRAAKKMADAPKIHGTRSRRKAQPIQAQLIQGSVSSFSGGKDSTYVALHDKTYPVHIAKLDNAARSRELTATLTMDLPIAPRVIPFMNSVPVHWSPQKYVLREAATSIVMTQVALDLGINTITLATYNREDFTQGMNSLYKEKGVPITIKTLENVNEEEVTSWLIKKQSEIFPHTVSCLLDNRMYAMKRSDFKRRFPQFPLFDGQCGSCDKDVRINMYRLLHDPLVMNLSHDIISPVAQHLVERTHKGTYDCCTPSPDLVQRITKRYL